MTIISLLESKIAQFQDHSFKTETNFFLFRKSKKKLNPWNTLTSFSYNQSSNSFLQIYSKFSKSDNRPENHTIKITIIELNQLCVMLSLKLQKIKR